MIKCRNKHRQRLLRRVAAQKPRKKTFADWAKKFEEMRVLLDEYKVPVAHLIINERTYRAAKLTPALTAQYNIIIDHNNIVPDNTVWQHTVNRQTKNSIDYKSLSDMGYLVKNPTGIVNLGGA